MCTLAAAFGKVSRIGWVEGSYDPLRGRAWELLERSLISSALPSSPLFRLKTRSPYGVLKFSMQTIPALTLVKEAQRVTQHTQQE